MKKYAIVIIVSLLNLQACATSKDSTMLGAVIGSVIGSSMGAAVGASRGNEKNGALAGAAFGATVGGLFGYLDHREEKRLAKLEKERRLFSIKKGTPDLMKPEVERVWVPERIDGERYEDGHYMYVIRRPSLWKKK